MKKTPFRVQLDTDIQAGLHELGAPHQLSGNSVLAAAAAELVKVHKAGGNLWQALGRIAADEGAQPAIPAATAPRIARSGHQRSLQPVT